MFYRRSAAAICLRNRIPREAFRFMDGPVEVRRFSNRGMIENKLLSYNYGFQFLSEEFLNIREISIFN